MVKKFYDDFELVETKEEILHNAETLYGYLSGNDETKKQYVTELIKNGRVFFVIIKNKELFFAPSRFIGYKENTMTKHEMAKDKGARDGKQTNSRISKILDLKRETDTKIEKKFLLFCDNLGITPKKYSSPRTYWFNRDDLAGSSNSIADEIADIQDFLKKNPKISAEEKLRYVKTRVGQGKIRNLLLSERKHCAVCGIKQEELLVASHIKPWAKCNDEEKGDLDNLLLLCAMHDALFDKRFISFDDEGKILGYESLDGKVKQIYGIDGSEQITVTEKMKKYLAEHRELFHVKKKN